MSKMHLLNYITFSIFCLSLIACVPQRKYQDQSMMTQKYLEEKTACNDKLNKATKENEDLKQTNSDLNKKLNYLIEDTAAMMVRYEKIKKLNEDLNNLYEKLLTQNKDLLGNASKEKEEYSVALTARELELNAKQKQMEELEDRLKKRESDAEQLRSSLESREKRVQELESIISRQDSSASYLKKKLVDALSAYNASDLSIEQRDGKIYLSISEKLLFSSGSYKLDSKGVEALKTVAQTLSKESNLNVLVEGHTDNVPFSSAQGSIEDNWDLSVMRASNVAKILITNGLNANQVVPSGRGDQMPIADNSTKEGRSKNRRTEIILQPDLGEILKLVNQQ